MVINWKWLGSLLRYVTHRNWRKTSLSAVGRPCGFHSNFGAPHGYFGITTGWKHLSEELWYSPAQCVQSEVKGQLTSLKPNQSCALSCSLPVCSDSFLQLPPNGRWNGCFWPLTEPYLLKGSQKMRRSCHPPGVCSNTPFSWQTYGWRTLPQSLQQYRFRKWRQRLTKSAPSNSSFLGNWASEWKKNRSRHIPRCKPPPYFYLKSEPLISFVPRVFFSIEALSLLSFQQFLSLLAASCAPLHQANLDDAWAIKRTHCFLGESFIPMITDNRKSFSGLDANDFSIQTGCIFSNCWLFSSYHRSLVEARTEYASWIHSVLCFDYCQQGG